MNVNEVITLDNDANYLILDIIEYNDIKYLYSVGLYDNGDLDYTDFVFFKETSDQEGFMVEPVLDDQIVKQLLLLVIVDLDESDEMTTILQEELEKLNEDR